MLSGFFSAAQRFATGIALTCALHVPHSETPTLPRPNVPHAARMLETSAATVYALKANGMLHGIMLSSDAVEEGGSGLDF